MHTYLPADATIDAYLRHYLKALDLDRDVEDCQYRLSKIVWVPIGGSGRILLSRLLKLLPGNLSKFCTEAHAPTAIYNRKTKKPSFSGIDSLDSPALKSRFADREVIVLDSSVHSGNSMQEVCRVVQSCNPQRISTFTFCLKRGSKFVPNYFALLIHDWDRALFWLPAIPVNRLDKDICQKNIQLRRIEDLEDCEDLSRGAILENGFDVFLFDPDDHKGQLFLNYVCTQNNVVHGHLVFQWTDDVNQGKGCRIRRIKITPNTENLNTALLLLRWTETCARHNCCNFIDLGCTDKRMRNVLINMGFEPVADTDLLRRKIIYGIKTNTFFPDEDSGHIFSQPIGLP